jgi:hypothetical protein
MILKPVKIGKGNNMQNNHILLEKSKKYNKKNQSEFLHKEYQYRPIDGYWSALVGGVALMISSVGPKPTTKKEDVETGEDRKGE